MELMRFPLRGGFSVRSILKFVLTVVITALLWTIFSNSPTQAVREGETATWQNNGQVLIFDRHTYSPTTDLPDMSGTIPTGATVYKSPLQNGPSPSSDKKVFVIYFAPGVDPPAATNATYVEFTYNSNSTVSNPKNKLDIPVELPGADGESGSSCSVTGVGWIICPLSVFMANAMDVLFETLSGFIEVQPSVLGDPTNSMYVAWNMMRNIANIAFVIAFIIIIYSQLTNVGISNYGLKKLIPRLIIAAVLVNISYIIAALAIDVSNILGYSIQDMFNIIREQTFHLTNDDLTGLNTNVWGALTAAVLAGGGLVGGVYYAASGGLHLLLAILMGLVLTAIFVIIILAARQAIIILLVIVSPLAFVANLLPNTEKWFGKWKDLFFTMLVFFPAFSLVFGGSQLAGQLIIQNADGDIVTLIFGLAVQVAPLVITPLILKLSGGVLGRVAQIANNPRKGLIDRTRNWGERRAEHAKQQNIARGPRLRNPASWGAGMVRGMDNKRRDLEENTDIWKQKATNRYEQRKKYAKNGGIYERKSLAEMEKSKIHSDHESHLEQRKVTPGNAVYEAAKGMQLSKEKLEARQKNTAGYYDRLRAIEGTDFNVSNNALETATSNASAYEQNKQAYLNQARMRRTTELGAAAERLETSKLNAEGWQNKYTAHIDELKLSGGSSIGDAARFAVSTKELSEATQNRVQTMFDRDRVTEGTSLNASNIILERTKLEAEAAKNVTARYVSDQKSNFEGALHTQAIITEQAKGTAKIGETQLQRVIEEYKTGRVTPPTSELTDVMNTMVRDAEQLAAETRGAQAAQNMQQGNVARAFTEMVDIVDANGNVIGQTHTDRANELLNVAASVDPHGRLRAKAAATSDLGKIEREALTNNIVLLDEQAEQEGINDVAWARSILQRQLGEVDPITGERVNQVPQDPGLLEAAVEKLAQDGDIGSVRTAMMEKLGGQGDEHKAIMNRVIARNAGNLKVKGGFDLQQKVSGLWGATREEMDQSIAFSLGAITAENISGQKWGWWHSYTQKDASGRTGLERIIDNVETMPDGEEKDTTKAMLRSFYANLSTALTNDEIMTKIGDRNEDTADMHKILHEHPGLIGKKVTINYDLAKQGIATPPPKPPTPPTGL